MFFFFFQAEDGIRDRDVTGVQTCALPISVGPAPKASPAAVQPPKVPSSKLPRSAPVGGVYGLSSEVKVLPSKLPVKYCAPEPPAIPPGFRLTASTHFCL